MRRIEFRGRDFKKKWHYGDLIANALNPHDILFGERDDMLQVKIREPNGKEFEVDPKTVGQNTFKSAYINKKSDKKV